MKTALFFCDINGTLTGESNMALLVNRLETLRDVYGCNKIIFSLISTENIETVKEYVSEILRHSNTVKLGKQFYEDGYYDYQDKSMHNENVDRSKLGQMIGYIKELSGLDDLSLICYADDNASEIFIPIFEKICPNAEVKIIVPSKKINSDKVISSEKYAISGLYACMDQIIWDRCNEIHPNLSFPKSKKIR